jgi:hypothetical protein
VQKDAENLIIQKHAVTFTLRGFPRVSATV